MASSTSSAALSLPTSSTLVDGKAPPRQSPQSVPLPTLPPSHLHSSSHSRKPASYRRRIARDVVAMATGEAPAEVVTTELPEIAQSVIEAWDKVEDKYAVSSLAVAGAVALWGSSGMISAIDRLPLIPGVMEIVGMAYTGWFAYKNLVFKPDREALLGKIKQLYGDIIGSS